MKQKKSRFDPQKSETLKAIRAIMGDSTPCTIEPREEQKPGPDEEREFMSSSELWKERLERLSDE